MLYRDKKWVDDELEVPDDGSYGDVSQAFKPEWELTSLTYAKGEDKHFETFFPYGQSDVSWQLDIADNPHWEANLAKDIWRF